MNTYLKHFVRKFSTVALHAQNSLSGYKYDDIDLTKNYRLRSLIYEIFDNRIDEGFHMAYIQFVEALHEKDFQFISNVADAKLQRSLEKCKIQLHNLNNGTKDVVYSDFTLIVGDKTEYSQPVKLSLFDCVNLDIYGNTNVRTEIENITVQVECYVLSQIMLNQQEEDESIYHRVLFQTKLLESKNCLPNLTKVLHYNSRKKIKYIKTHFIGKKFEWRIMEIDQFNY